ncbi:MAG TPA: AI-2E family transporter [Cyclobacteriaceae bacterium]|nr:AI-2E family transporter [Cyclobacteriaceae bacterium]
MKTESEKNFKLLVRCVLILTVMAVLAIFIVARSFFYPILLGVMLSYLIYPLAKFFEPKIGHSGVSILFSILISLGATLGFIFLFYQQFSIFLDDFPLFQEQAFDNLTAVQNYISEKTSLSFSSDDWLKSRISEGLKAQQDFIGDIFNATTATLVALGVQPVYIFFMLYYRHNFRKFLFQVTQKKDHSVLKKILFEITSVTKNYVSGIFLVVLILCFTNSIGLMIIGVEYFILLGIISAIFNLIPYFGTLIGGAVPLLYTFVSPDPSDAIGVIILFLIIQVLENNVLTPTITGGRVAVNPFFTIISIIFGGFVWGIPGMFLSVPLMGIFKVVCQNITPLKPIAFLLSFKKSSEQKSDDSIE